jgi:hypothetical protein
MGWDCSFLRFVEVRLYWWPFEVSATSSSLDAANGVNCHSGLKIAEKVQE